MHWSKNIFYYNPVSLNDIVPSWVSQSHAVQLNLVQPYRIKKTPLKMSKFANMSFERMHQTSGAGSTYLKYTVGQRHDYDNDNVKVD